MLPYPGDPSHLTLWVNDQSQRVGPQFLAGSSGGRVRPEPSGREGGRTLAL